jgi:hypothetical protein
MTPSSRTPSPGLWALTRVARSCSAYALTFKFARTSVALICDEALAGAPSPVPSRPD